MIATCNGGCRLGNICVPKVSVPISRKNVWKLTINFNDLNLIPKAVVQVLLKALVMPVLASESAVEPPSLCLEVGLAYAQSTYSQVVPTKA